MTDTSDERLEATFAGRYRLLRVVGRGGMATVYLAEDLRHGRQVALKVFRSELALASGAERFLREIQVTAQLTHPHILPLLDSGDTGSGLFYTMPFVEGESLRQRLDREPQLPVGEAVGIIRSIAGALDYAHSRGIIHRDLKPENVLLAPGSGGLPHPWLSDFGIARALEAAGGERLTETGLALGTPAYMSPEQASASPRLDGRSDIYSLGCVAYEMLAGAPPFTGATAQAILARHAVDPVPPLRTVRPSVPVPVASAIERALAKVPADRLASAREVADAMTAGAGTAPRPRSWTVPRPRTVATGVAALTAMLATTTVLLRESRAPAVLPSASRIAVLPLLSPAGDTGLARLGRDLATTIAASLEGIGGIETADRLTIATNTEAKNDLSPAAGAALARRLGATSVVRGTLVGAGNAVRLDLGIYGLDGRDPLADGISVTAHRDSIGALTDSASWALLRKVWRRGDPPSPSLEAVTTGSLPALRAFLEGERALATNRWDDALLAYGSAVAADSSFWLARFRHALSQYWNGQPVDPDYLGPLALHLHLLPERERLLIASMIDTIPMDSRIERSRAVTQRFPNYWPGWFLYADMLYHYAPNVGHDWIEAVEGFQRVVALNPNLIPAWGHLYSRTSWGGHPEAPRALARLIELGWTGHRDPFARLEVGVRAARGMIPRHVDAVADSLAELMVTSPGNYRRRYDPTGLRLLEGGYPAAQLDLNARAMRLEARGIGPEVRTVILASNAWSWAARGRWDSALSHIAVAAAERPGVIGPHRYAAPQFPPIGGPALAIESYGMAVVGAWLGATSPDEADRRRAAALSVVPRLEDEESRSDARGRLAWLDGILGYTRQSPGQIRAARVAVGRSGYRQAAQVDASLATFERALAGDRAGAGTELASLELRCINTNQPHSFTSEAESCNEFTPHIAIQRLAAAQWLREAGEVEEAVRLLRYQDAAIWGGWPWAFNAALAAPTQLLRARLDEERGNAERAQEHYRKFLGLYDQPMPSLAPLVEEARTALARLSEQDRSGGTR